MRSCVSCGSDITAARLEAIPDTELCTECQAQHDIPRVRGFMSWAHKTAPEIIIGPAADKLHEYDRKGVHAQLPLGNVNNPRIVKSMQSIKDSTIVANYVRGREAVRMEATVRVKASRCHPDRPRATPDGKCVECAIAWYQNRRR